MGLGWSKANILSLPTIALKMKSTTFLDDDEKKAAATLLAGIKKQM
jgi:hypothetical protein